MEKKPEPKFVFLLILAAPNLASIILWYSTFLYPSQLHDWSLVPDYLITTATSLLTIPGSFIVLYGKDKKSLVVGGIIAIVTIGVFFTALGLLMASAGAAI